MNQPSIVSVGTALPPHYVTQAEITSALADLWAGKDDKLALLRRLHRSTEVQGRYMSLPLQKYVELKSFGEANSHYTRAALDLAETACARAIAEAGLSPADIDSITTVTVTGISTPSLDARLVNRIGLPARVKRTPIFGLGCVAGAAGIARVSDYLRGFPSHTALLVSVELCTLTVQPHDQSVENIIATGLFGDGAAAVVLRGADHLPHRLRPRVVASESVFYPDTERVMGWDVKDSGFKVVLSGSVPTLVQEKIRGDVDRFLQNQGLSRADIRHWVLHTGGPKVLSAFATALELPDGALDRSWQSLRSLGNLSSSSVLFVLSEFLADPSAQPGDLGMLLAMGPGFCSELVLLRW